MASQRMARACARGSAACPRTCAQLAPCTAGRATYEGGNGAATPSATVALVQRHGAMAVDRAGRRTSLLQLAVRAGDVHPRHTCYAGCRAMSTRATSAALSATCRGVDNDCARGLPHPLWHSARHMARPQQRHARCLHEGRGRGRFVPLEVPHLLRALIQDGLWAGGSDDSGLIQLASLMDNVVHMTCVHTCACDSCDHAVASLTARTYNVTSARTQVPFAAASHWRYVRAVRPRP